MKVWRIAIKIIVTIALIGLFVSCSNYKMINYYSDENNYITVIGTVEHIKYNADKTELHIGFSNMSVKCDDTSFKIVGENLSIVRQNGIDDKLQMGDEISFVTAPKYFGDGYVMPIVALEIDQEVLLDFEQGCINLLDWLK